MQGSYSDKACVPRIRASYQNMTQIEKTIADYFLSVTSRQDFAAKVIAKKLAVSEASLSRFAKKCGYEGYRQFIYEYTASLANKPEQITKSSQNILRAYQNLLDETRTLMDEVQMARAARNMETARRIFILGKGSSASAAEEMAMRFMRIGLDVRSISEEDNMKIQSALARPEDLVIGLSLSGKSLDVLECLKSAKSRQARTMLFTSRQDPALNAYCDEVIHVPSLEHLHYGNSISPQFPLLVSVDLLYAACMALNVFDKRLSHDDSLKALHIKD